VSVTANPDGTAATYGSGRYAHGDTVEIGFHLPDTAAEGGYWQFIGWDDTNATDNPRMVVVVSDTLFTALFQWVADSVGIVDVEGLTRWVSVYPNPASHTVVIRSERDCTVAFLSADGREVMRRVCRAGDTSVDIQHLAQGVYFLRILDMNQLPIKFIVTKE
ncbi:MAG: T9SS type A sorting domain-containing protein, partial [Bacteroidales bacterium]|nr:T9SS type A sorting domain-containing protein [Bacteroidales bacterium]